jgi:hypothetical protein
VKIIIETRRPFQKSLLSQRFNQANRCGDMQRSGDWMAQHIKCTIKIGDSQPISVQRLN